jgi:hypothetical protein
MSLGDASGFADLDEAVRLAPDNYAHYQTRSRVYATLGRRREAEADRRKAAELHAAAVAASKAAEQLTDEFPVAWQTFVSEAGAYRAEFPGVPEPMPDEPGELVLKRMLLSDVNGIDYMASYCDLNETYRTRYPTVEDRLNWNRTRANENFEVRDERRVEVQSRPALEMTMRNKEGSDVLYRVIPVGDRMYYVLAGGSPDAYKAAAGDIRRFVESFQPRNWKRSTESSNGSRSPALQ